MRNPDSTRYLFVTLRMAHATKCGQAFKDFVRTARMRLSPRGIASAGPALVSRNRKNQDNCGLIAAGAGVSRSTSPRSSAA